MQFLSRRGFTLLELAIVLTLIGVIIGGGLVVLTANVQSTQFNKTVARMDIIDKTLLNYATANYRVPCPSSLTITAGSANYGVEAANKGTCWSGTPAASFKATSGTVEGGVPTRTLQLPDDYMYDGWGRRLRYAVDPVYTVSNSLPIATYCTLNSGATPTSITVNDASGAARTTAAIYALISHGANGHGAFTPAGVMMNTGSTNTYEKTNCHCNSSGTSTTYSPTYVQKSPTLNSASTTDNFDDIVSFKEAWQLQAPNFPPTGNCSYSVYVTDQSNNRVQVFSPGGAYLSQFGSNGPNAGMFNIPGGIAIDSSGNIWVADQGNNRIEEFSSTGAYIGQIGCSGSGTCSSSAANGSFHSPAGMVFDSSGNMWVVDQGNNRVEKLSSTGSYISQLGCGGTGGCANSATNGKFAYPQAVAIDPSGNIWVADMSNDRVQEFNSSGTYVLQLGCASGACSNSTANGKFAGTIYGVAADASGNIYVPDFSNNRVEKFSSSGTYVSQIGGCSSGQCSSSSASGSFNGADTVWVDGNGNIWVSDDNNQRVQEFSGTGSFILAIGSGYQGASGSIGSSGTGNGQFNGPNFITTGTR